MTTPPEPTIQCPRCLGGGKVFDDAEIGASLRQKRLDNKVLLLSTAKKLHISSQYLLDLEKGNRHWRVDRVLLYLAAIGEVN